ncbi:ABC transporter substrate-binding protein/permease [Konateibacter massiliensis]|uniref:ABC transporter substrate-binding protein/permease n=1 Tax=Konateibacter massiliensis TaxID=2002841 RepID=UPI000C156455|nr:ABC transporter substrate-binding protein/permease [Konateibacter massiliensis]
MKRLIKRKALGMIMLIVMLSATFLLSGCGSNSVGKSPVSNADDLAGATIGVQLGTTGDLYVSDYESEGSTILRYTKAADAIQALKQGKVDCIVVDKAPAEAFLNNNTDLSALEDEFTQEDYAICISKENTELKEKINQAIATLNENGTIERIIQNYIGDSTKGQYPYEKDTTVERTNGTLVVATNATFEPYEYMQGEEIVGIDIDLAQAICDLIGMDLKVENIEFDAIINAVQSGKADIGIAGMTVTEERLQSIDFTDSYTTSTQVIVVRNGESNTITSLKQKIYNNFIDDNRYMYIVKGLLTTLEITILAIILGVVVGFLVGILRTACDSTGKYKLLNLLLKGYLTIIRGTPTMIQLLIIYYVVFASSDMNKVLIAVIAFGINSSAYIAEIVRSGINSIDPGQFEAARSMGLSYPQTMRYIIMPQAVKNVLPALGNEFIVLLKETAITGYIGIMDLTRGGDYIRSRTFEAFLPLIAVALVYLCIVVILTACVSAMERKLRTDGK